MKKILFLILICFNTVLFAGEKNTAPFKRSAIETDVQDNCRREYFTLYSPSMERDIKIVIVLPPEYDAHKDMKYPVLYTLHGAGAPYATFAEMSALRKKLSEKPMIITCFDAGNASCYVDAVNKKVEKGVMFRKPRKNKNNTEEEVAKALAEWEKIEPEVTSLYTTFFFDEFIPAIDSFYRVNGLKRALTGFSMGGAGSLTYILQKPEMFSAAYLMSSAFYSKKNIKRRNSLSRILGDYETNKKYYEPVLHFKKVKKCAEKKVPLPPIFLHCGLEDLRFLETNREMYKLLQENGYEVFHKESEGGHNWTFWNGSSADIIDFIWKYVNK